MSCVRALLTLFGPLTAIIASGCGASQPSNPNQAAATLEPIAATDVGSAVYQPHAAAIPARAEQAALPVAPPAPAPETAFAAPSPAPPGVDNNPSLDRGGSFGGGVASGDVPALAAAINQWRVQADLRGVKRIDDKPVLAGYSWMTYLLPYVGHDDVYSRFDFSKGWHDRVNMPNACQVIPAFLDPNNPNRHMKIVGVKDALGPAFTHFVGMAGVEDSRNLVAAALARSDPRAGIFGYDQIARPEEITDGASNTILLINAGKIAGPWVSGGGATIRGARPPYFDSITGFGSPGDAKGGGVAAMADGSVRRFSKEIDPGVFRALCTIHGGETIDLPADSVRSR